MKHSRSYLLTLLVLLAVTACGGGGGESFEPPVTDPPASDSPANDPPVTDPQPPEDLPSIGGKVIDGYVSGATVWLDINGNGQYDDSEPSAVSGSAGDYSLELTEAQSLCLAYANLYVDVPVGALDEDTGPVSEAYQMVLPARFSDPTEGEAFNISPLTTVLAEQLSEVLINNGQDTNSCADLLDNVQLAAEIKQYLDGAVRDVIARYNISEVNIYADFIETDNVASRDLALSIVTGLKASYSYKATANERFPNADYIRVEFFQGSETDNNNAYPDAWYRSIAVWLSDGFKSELIKLSEDLSEDIRPIYLRDVVDTPWGQGTISLTRDIFSFDGDDSGYSCANSEAVSITRSGVTYRLDNGSPRISASDVDTCINNQFFGGDYRYFSVDYYLQDVHYHSRFTVNDEFADFSVLSDWVQLEAKADDLNFDDLVDYFETLEYPFDTAVDNARYYSWYKRSTDDTGANRIQIEQSSSGEWERLSYNDDGTYLQECSNDGENWGSCEE